MYAEKGFTRLERDDPLAPTMMLPDHDDFYSQRMYQTAAVYKIPDVGLRLSLDKKVSPAPEHPHLYSPHPRRHCRLQG